MGIFDSLKNAIFGSHAPAPPPVPTPPSAQASGPSGAPKSSAAPPVTPAGRDTTSPPATPSGAPVDIQAMLSQRAAQKHEKLNWQSSIVDLMKLVDLDPSFDNRKTLAKELGYTGDTQDSASMNIWLHKEVMHKLAAGGGQVPDSLRH